MEEEEQKQEDEEELDDQEEEEKHEQEELDDLDTYFSTSFSLAALKMAGYCVGWELGSICISTCPLHKINMKIRYNLL